MLRRSAIEQSCSCDKGVYLTYTTEEYGRTCQWMTEVDNVFFVYRHMTLNALYPLVAVYAFL